MFLDRVRGEMVVQGGDRRSGEEMVVSVCVWGGAGSWEGERCWEGRGDLVHWWWGGG